MMKFLSLKNGQKYGRTEMQVEIVNDVNSVLCKLRKDCGQLEPNLSKIVQFVSL